EAREEQRGGFLALQERLGAWGGELRGEVAGSRDALLRASAGLDARVGALAEAVAQARAQREQAEGASRERDEALAADIGRASGALRARLDDVASRLDEGAKARHEAVLDGLRAEAGLLRDEAKLRAEEHAHELARLQERVSSLRPALLGRLDAAQEAQAGRDAEIGSRLDEFARRLAEARSSLEGAVRSSVGSAEEEVVRLHAGLHALADATARMEERRGAQATALHSSVLSVGEIVLDQREEARARALAQARDAADLRHGLARVEAAAGALGADAASRSAAIALNLARAEDIAHKVDATREILDPVGSLQAQLDARLERLGSASARREAALLQRMMALESRLAGSEESAGRRDSGLLGAMLRIEERMDAFARRAEADALALREESARRDAALRARLDLIESAARAPAAAPASAPAPAPPEPVAMAEAALRATIDPAPVREARGHRDAAARALENAEKEVRQALADMEKQLRTGPTLSRAAAGFLRSAQGDAERLLERVAQVRRALAAMDEALAGASA